MAFTLRSARYCILDNTRFGDISDHMHKTNLIFIVDQGLKWIINNEFKNQVQEIRYDDINYLKEMKAAISQGHIVVLVNVKDKLDPELGKFNDLKLESSIFLTIFNQLLIYTDNLLEKRTFVTSDEKTVIQIGSELVPWSPKFRMYLITKEENSASNLELASKVECNLIVSSSCPLFYSNSQFDCS
jgi:hypothetical protein